MEEAKAVIEKRRRRRRVLALLVLLVPIVLLGGVWLFLQSGAGEALVRRQVLDAAGNALQGKVKATGVRLDGEHLVLEGLELYTPEGELVAAIARLEADVELNALARQRVHLSHVKITQPRLFLVEDERGWNLSRAVAAKNPSAPGAPSGPSRWTVQVDEFELFDGVFELTQEERHVAASKLGAKGHAFVQLEPLEVKGDVNLKSQLTAPLEDELSLNASASVSQGPQRYGVDLKLGGTKLRGTVELPALALSIDELIAAPRELKAFVPAYPLQQVVTGEGTVSPTLAKLTLRAGKGVVTVDSKHDLEKHSAERFAVSVKNLDLSELAGAPLASLIDLDASGSLADWRPSSLTGALQATGRWDAKGQRLASLSLGAKATNGTVDVQRLGLETPGAVLSARGQVIALQRLAMEGTLEAPELAAVQRTLATFAGVDVPGLAGSGALNLTVRGPLDEPSLKAVGRFERVAVASLAAEGVELDADFPDLLHPLDSDLLVKARRLNVSGRAFEEVKLDFITHGRELDLDLTTRGLGDLRVHARGRLERDSNGAEVDTLELTTSEVRWVLEAPTRVAWSPRGVVAPFSLKDGDQRLAGELKLAGSRLDANVRAEQLHLEKLPKLLALDELGLAGTVSADVTATGRTSKPDVVAKVTLREGKVKGFTQLDVDLDGAWKQERATGTVDARSALGRVSGTFDLPVFAFLEEKPIDGRAQLRLEGVELEKLAAQLDRELPAKGTISGTLDVSGTGDHPEVKLTATSPELVVATGEQTLTAKNAEVIVATDDAHHLGAQVQFVGLGGTQQATLWTPFTLASLRRGLPERQALLETPVRLSLELQRVEVTKLAEAGLVAPQEGLAGALSLSATIEGTALAPTGQGIVNLEGVHLGSLKGVGGKITVRTSAEKQTQLTADLSVTGKPAATLTATVDALPERALRPLLAPNGTVDGMILALVNVPLDAELEVRPFDVAQVLPRRTDGAVPGGALSARLEVKGTLEAPTARLYGAMQNLRFDRVALGSARFDLKSTPQQQTFTVALGGQGRDDLKAKGTTGLDLRLSSLRKGLQWKSAPVEVAIESRNFDLGFLSGSTEQLRAVAGRLDLTGNVKGTLGLPSFDGDATVRQGRLALAGNGDYRNIELEVHADDKTFELRKLEAKSGPGTASLVAKAVKQPSGVWLLTSQGKTDSFPIVNDDQLLATASLKYVLEGDVSSTLVDIRSLALPRVDVTLPEIKRKDIQDLERPADIIVLRGGKRPTKKQREESRETVVAQQAAAPFVLRARIDALRNIWVRSSDVNLELGLSEGFRVEYRDDVRLFGEARLLKGDLEVIGRKFTVQKGSEARFAGSATQPYVNVTALHENTREQVKITVTVAGRGTDVTIKTTSEPPMSESDIYAVLATGRRNLKTSGGTALSPGQAASVVGQYAASFLKTGLAKALPIDVFNFDTSDNFEKVKLDVGKYLSDSVYLGGSVNFGARRERGENMWAGRIELQLTRSVSLEAYAGDALSFGADAMWSRDF